MKLSTEFDAIYLPDVALYLKRVLPDFLAKGLGVIY